MNKTTSICESLLCGEWHLIKVEDLHGNDDVIRRCPECKASIKLMKIGKNGQRAHFEHNNRNPNCRTGSAYNWDVEYNHNPIHENKEQIENSYQYSKLLQFSLDRISVGVEGENEVYWEGAEKFIIHRTKERDTKLAKNKKEIFFKEHGRLFCEVCGFDFFIKYGERGFGYIECHHNKPVSELDYSTQVLINDLSLLCSNCHRIIHRTKPWLSIEKLKQHIND